jgi:hypothetical protein
MTDRLTTLDDDGLGRALTSAAREVAWPDTPDLAGRVSRAVRERGRHPSRLRLGVSMPSRRRTLVLVMAGLLLLAAAAVAAKIVIDLGAITIDTIPGRPTALPTAIASGPTLGHAATLEEAEDEAGFRAMVPRALGDPDAVWVDVTTEGSRIVMAWSPTALLPAVDDLPWGAVLYEFRGQMEQAAKSVFLEGNTFEEADVGGLDGLWIAGPHELDLVTDDGAYASYRVTGNVLVWKSDGVVLRLETSLRKAAALRLGESIPH